MPRFWGVLVWGGVVFPPLGAGCRRTSRPQRRRWGLGAVAVVRRRQAMAGNNIIEGLATASRPSLVHVANRIGVSDAGTRLIIAGRIVERLEAGLHKKTQRVR